MGDRPTEAPDGLTDVGTDAWLTPNGGAPRGQAPPPGTGAPAGPEPPRVHAAGPHVSDAPGDAAPKAHAADSTTAEPALGMLTEPLPPPRASSTPFDAKSGEPAEAKVTSYTHPSDDGGPHATEPGSTPLAPKDVPESHADEDQESDAEAEALQRAVESLTKQLSLKYPLQHEQVCSMMLQNQQVAASVTVPASLGFEAPAKAEEPVDQPKLERFLERDIEQHRRRLAEKTEMLKKQYRQYQHAWTKACERLDRIYERRDAQRRAAQPGHAPGADSNMPALGSGLQTPVPVSRTYRRGALGSEGFGDAVRSEAEFLEILASLENADMQDPAMRAARTAAAVPDMELRVDGRPDPNAVLQLEDDNYYVADSAKFFFDEFDPDVWSDEERAIFEKRYAKYPKQFGRIAAGLPHKSMQACVRFYYLHKHQEGYGFKELSSARSRERKRKSKSVRPKKAKGSELLADITSAQTGEAPVPASASPDAEARDPSPKRSSATPRSGGSKKRAADEGGATPADAAASKPPSASKRVRTTPKPAQLPDEPEPRAEPDAERERDLAAAEALEALASVGTPQAAPADTGKAPPARKEGEHETKSRSRGSHWTAHERAEFMRWLPVYGKDWEALAAALPTKSPTQARNFYVRHAPENDFFRAAVEHAMGSAELGLEKRMQAASEFASRWPPAQPSGNSASATQALPEEPRAWPPHSAPARLPQEDEEATDEEDREADGGNAPHAWHTPSGSPYPHPPAYAWPAQRPYAPRAHGMYMAASYERGSPVMGRMPPGYGPSPMRAPPPYMRGAESQHSPYMVPPRAPSGSPDAYAPRVAPPEAGARRVPNIPKVPQAYSRTPPNMGYFPQGEEKHPPQ